ncbi:MAG: twin-arginine translocase subunit TatC [Campylobacterales bacterium]|nr:twin-arginine translocase subunit TatC [Campylobacterales bacterium]
MFEDLKPHIAELRERLVYSILALLVAFFICFGFWEIILEWMVAPLKESLPKGSDVIFTKVGEAFFTALKVSFFTGFILSLPVIFWQFWMFIAPGLYENEKVLVIPFVVSASLMFFLGAMFAYYVVFPIGFSYLVNFGSQLFTALPSIGDYVTFFAKLMIGFGISFELPVLTFFLAKLGLVDDKSLKDFFRYAIVIIFIVAAVLTPPDVISQFLMAIPLIILYGVSILIAKAVNPYQEPDEKIEETIDDEE